MSLHLWAHYGTLIKPALTSILRHFSPVETFILHQYINQEMHLTEYNSWQVLKTPTCFGTGLSSSDTLL